MKPNDEIEALRIKAALADRLADAGRRFLGNPNEPFVISLKAADDLEKALAEYDAIRKG